MEIPKYDKKETTNNFKQLYDCMPDRCFRMLICGKSGCGKNAYGAAYVNKASNFIMIGYTCIQKI